MLRSVRTVLALALGCAPLGCGDAKDAPPGVASANAYDREGRLLRPAPARAGARPNVILVLIDTLRADAVDPEHPERAAMPRLSALARANVCFTNASSPAPWTLPSVLSMLTSRLPHVHGVTGEELSVASVASLTSWAEILRAQGYRTSAFVGTRWPQAREGLLQGFDEVGDGFQLQTAAATLDPWIAAQKPGQPFFLFLHTYEAHDPYGPEDHPPQPRAPPTKDEADALLAALGPEPAAHDLVRRMVLDGRVRDLLMRDPRARPWQAQTTRYLWSGLAEEPRPALAQELARAYRDGLTWVDGLLQQTLDRLERAGQLDGTLLLVTGDHGEAFGEHGMLLHGRALYDELLRVPLVARGPAPFDLPRVVTGSVGLTDLEPTVLDLAGLPPPDEADGRSLLPLLRAGGAGRPVEAEEARTHFHTAGTSVATLGSVRSATHKFVATYEMMAGTYREELYDLVRDAGERTNLADPDGVARALPDDGAFCRAVERQRARLWGASARLDFTQARQGYGSGLRVLEGERPSSPCAPTGGD